MLVKIWNFHSLLVGMQSGIVTLEEFGSSNKAKFGLITGAKIALEGIYPNDLKTRAHTKTCM